MQNREVQNQELKGLRILVVDDIADNQALLLRRLQKSGAQVDIAVNGLEGVTMALQRQYDLILMDLQMPVVDGLTAASHLRKCGFKKPIVACTAHLDERENAINNHGFDDFFAKPLDLQSLVNRLRRFQVVDFLKNAQPQH
jgi:CheY-like chemotaxis protein